MSEYVHDLGDPKTFSLIISKIGLEALKKNYLIESVFSDKLN